MKVQIETEENDYMEYFCLAAEAIEHSLKGTGLQKCH